MYENEYYFIDKPKDREDLPFLQADKNTTNRNYNFEALPLGQAPLKFFNAWKEECKVKGIKTLVPGIMFNGTDLVVNDPIRERLLNYDMPHLHIYPAIYVDDRDHWHEDRWFLTFTEEFDCWDRETSNYDQEGPPIRLGGFEYYQVYNHKFNAALMDKTPLKDRLLFKLGSTIDAYIVAHESILYKVFGSSPNNGAEYIKVSDY